VKIKGNPYDFSFSELRLPFCIISAPIRIQLEIEARREALCKAAESRRFAAFVQPAGSHLHLQFSSAVVKDLVTRSLAQPQTKTGRTHILVFGAA